MYFPAIPYRLLFATLLVSAGAIAQAELIEIVGVIKAVDPGKRTISLARETAKGERLDVLDVAQSAGRVADSQIGVPVMVRFDTTLEVVTRLLPMVANRPVDPETVENLSVEQARCLVPFRPDQRRLDLPRLKELSVEAARELATHADTEWEARFTVMIRKEKEDPPGVPVCVCEPEERTRKMHMRLSLPGLTRITEPVARELVRYPGPLALDGLESLSSELADVLATHGQWLSLSGVKNLEIDVAEALASHKGFLVLDSLESIPDSLATVLAAHAGPMSLNGVTSISDKAVAVLGDKATLSKQKKDSPNSL